MLGLGLSLFSAVNLVVLARTKRFERYVIALISSGPPFVLAANILAGGVTSNDGGLVWAFLSGLATLCSRSDPAAPRRGSSPSSRPSSSR